MIAAPRPDEHRAAQIRSTLYDMVSAEAAPRRARKMKLVVSVAAAVLLVTGGGIALAASLPHPGTQPGISAATGTPAASSPTTAGPEAGTTTVDPTAPSYIDGAGSPSPTPVVPKKTALQHAYDACSAYVTTNHLGTLRPFQSAVLHDTTNNGEFALEPAITTPSGTKAVFGCILPGYPSDFTVSPQSSVFDAN